MLDLYARAYIDDLAWTMREIDATALDRVANLLLRARRDDRQVVFIGNGGSAALASHMACDLGTASPDVGRPQRERFRALSLSDNTALITALGNDISFEDIFVEQLRLVLTPDDVVVLISASGNSPNVVNAATYARALGATTIGLLGFGGGKLGEIVDHAVVAISRNYGIAQDFHQVALHILTQYLKRVVSGPARPVAFLDRDGVINERPSAPQRYVERWDQFRFVDGALAALRALSERGVAIVVVTNQQGIGKGTMSVEALHDVHAKMTTTLEAEGVRVNGIFYCPHLEDAGCFCRKPKPGLIHRAMNETGFLVDHSRSVLIGDSESDMRAGRAAGLTTILVGSGDPAARRFASHVADTLADAVQRVLAAGTAPREALDPRTG